MSKEIFISHSSKDTEIAKKICDYLESQGFSCWIAPRDITPGIKWAASIIKAINESKLFVLIFSANSNTSVQVFREVEKSVNNQIPIIPIKIEEEKISEELEYYISSHQWLNMPKKNIEKYFEQLKISVSKIINLENSQIKVESKINELSENLKIEKYRSAKSKRFKIIKLFAIPVLFVILIFITLILYNKFNKNSINEQNVLINSKFNLNGHYTGTIKDGTYWELYINEFDGKKFTGKNLIYWNKSRTGLLTAFSGTYDEQSNEISMNEDKFVKNGGIFSGHVLDNGLNINGIWKKYSDNSTYNWSLTKQKDTVVVPGEYPECSTRFLNDEDLSSKSNFQLSIMRNEIFARYGYKFSTNKEMIDYFIKKSWYSPQYDDVTSMLNKYEIFNIDLIKKYEK